jgi:hypothetical protein
MVRSQIVLRCVEKHGQKSEYVVLCQESQPQKTETPPGRNCDEHHCGPMKSVSVFFLRGELRGLHLEHASHDECRRQPGDGKLVMLEQ